MELGERLKKIREEKGYSIEVLASSIELTPEEITAWENNTSTPDARGLMRLSKIYGMSIDRILYEKDFIPEYDESKAAYASRPIEDKTEKEPVKNSEENPGNGLEGKASGKGKRQKKKMTVSEWMTVFVFPVFCIIIYLCMGVILGIWHPTWVILVLIPFYFILFFLLRGIGNKVDSAVEEYVEEYVMESEKEKR